MTPTAALRETSIETRSWRFEGRVQGVGFRPHVWRLARELAVVGEVYNEGDSACVVAAAPPHVLDQFVDRLRSELPDRASVDVTQALPIDDRVFDAFRIVDSVATESVSRFPLDTRTCQACLDEVHDPADRRYGYVFTNCMDCGPRYSIIDSLPYDRPATAMADFPMCDDCLKEYGDPANRRFHAQPIACPTCGPQLEYRSASGMELVGDPLELTIAALRAGEIIAVKSLGGFHLVCDATNARAVALLRQRKQRPTKPFAVMVADVSQAGRLCRLTPDITAALTAPDNPIVLAPWSGAGVAAAVAPKQCRLGLLLPTTPLHALLSERVAQPLVLTSGNISGQPQCIDNDIALAELAPLVDGFLLHDRPIRNRLDDSVVWVGSGQRAVMRRARGLAPAVLPWPAGFSADEACLAMGAHLKNTCAVSVSDGALVSPHIGDLESGRAQQEAEQAVDLLLRGTGAKPAMIVVDCHPDYASTQAGEARGDAEGLPLTRVQHHHAHMAACLFENTVPMHAPPLLGLVLDGMGLAESGEIWGGEWLLGGYREVARVAHLAPRPLLGGAVAMREPWRNLLAFWLTAPRDTSTAPDMNDLEALQAPLERFGLEGLTALADNPRFSPSATSGGRLIDAMAAVVVPDLERQYFEGEAGMLLEALALSASDAETGYAVPAAALSHESGVDFSALLWCAVSDRLAGISPEVVSRRLLCGLADGIARKTLALAQQHGADTVAMSGGVFQNPTLLMMVVERLERANLAVLRHQQLSANDENISLGQLAVALARQGEH